LLTIGYVVASVEARLTISYTWQRQLIDLATSAIVDDGVKGVPTSDA
jgi:hypothetical protein